MPEGRRTIGPSIGIEGTNMDQTQRIRLVDAVDASASELSPFESTFAGQIATAVWLGNLTEQAALEALTSYAIACHLRERANSLRLRAALLTEYRRTRERQDLVS